MYLFDIPAAPRLPEGTLCKDCNIILVSLDTLSFNHLPCYGYERDTAPNLCSFAKKNALFSNAFSNATWTLPGHASIFTSLYPNEHKLTILYSSILSPSVPFLPKTLQAHGYKTIFVMPASDDTLPLRQEFYRGIDSFYDTYSTSAENPWNSGLQEFKTNVQSGIKTFLFLHTYEVHAPYLIEDKLKLYTKDSIDKIPKTTDRFNFTDAEFYPFLYTQLAESLKKHEHPAAEDIYRKILTILDDPTSTPANLQERLRRYENYLWHYKFNYSYTNKIDITSARDIEYIRALYDQRIHEMDEKRISNLLSFIHQEQISKNTVVLITSDHGEEFMEHGNIYHESIYDSNLRIPFILSIPGMTRSQTIAAPVQSADIFPTLLDIVGIPQTDTFQGRSIVPLVRGKELPQRLVVADGFELDKRALRKGAWKLLLKKANRTYQPYELYDTGRDPQETMNVYLSHVDIAKDMIEEYHTTEKTRNNTMENLSE